jgi:hypothetical protein
MGDRPLVEKIPLEHFLKQQFSLLYYLSTYVCWNHLKGVGSGGMKLE